MRFMLKQVAMLPDFSNLTMNEERTDAPNINERKTLSRKYKTNKEHVYENLMTKQSGDEDNDRLPNIKKGPLEADDIRKRKLRIGYIEPVDKGNWGNKFSNHVGKLRGLHENLRFFYNGEKGFMLRSKEWSKADSKKRTNDETNDTAIEAGQLICIVSGVYCTDEAYNKLSASAKQHLDNYAFTVANVVKMSELDRLAESVVPSSVPSDSPQINKITFFKGLEMTKLRIVPRLQTTIYDDVTETYIQAPKGVYNPEACTAPLMWDGYAPHLKDTSKQPAEQPAEQRIQGVLDAGFLANHSDDPNVRNAAVRPFIVTPKDEEDEEDEKTERIVMAMFATQNIGFNTEIVIDYGYDPCAPTANSSTTAADADADDDIQDWVLKKETVDDFALYSKCLRVAGKATIEDQYTDDFLDEVTRSKTCLFYWPEWEPTWKKLHPYAEQCGPLVKALQVGKAASFSVLAARVVSDDFASDDHLSIDANGRITTFLESVLMRGGEYIYNTAVPSAGYVPRYRSPLLKAIQSKEIKIFEFNIKELQGQIASIYQLSNQVQDAYQASTNRLITESAQKRRDELFELYEAIENLERSVSGVQAQESTKDAFLRYINSNIFLNNVVEGGIVSSNTEGYEWVKGWSRSNSEKITRVFQAYEKYLANLFSPDLIALEAAAQPRSDEQDPPRRIYANEAAKQKTER